MKPKTPKPKTKVVRIKSEDIEVDSLYLSHVKDLIKILSIDGKKVVIYNVTGSHKMWTTLDRLDLVEKIK